MKVYFFIMLAVAIQNYASAAVVTQDLGDAQTEEQCLEMIEDWNDEASVDQCMNQSYEGN